MSTELAIALAALAGAALGGLVTVWATHRTNVATAERERAQRLHDLQAAEYAEAKEVLSEFLGKWWSAVDQGLSGAQRQPALRELATLASRVHLRLPGLDDRVREMVRLGMDPKKQQDSSEYREFFAAALVELEKLKPGSGVENLKI